MPAMAQDPPAPNDGANGTRPDADSAPTVGMQRSDGSQDTVLSADPGAEISPTHLPPADPYADTHIRDRSELFGDAPTNPTLHAATSTVLDDPNPSSVNLGMPGPAAEPLPTEVRPRPAALPSIPSFPWARMAVIFVVAVAFGAGVVTLLR